MDGELRQKERQREWARLIANGDHQAFGEMLDDFAPRLRRVCSNMCRDYPVLRGKIEDFLQETFLKGWKSRCLYKGSRGPLYAWYVAILRNTIRDELRNMKKCPEVNVESFVIERVPADTFDGGSLESEVTCPEANPRRMDAVKTALNQLSHNQREVLLTKCDPVNDALTEAEKAAKVQMTSGAFRKTACVALRRIRDLVKVDGEMPKRTNHEQQ